MDGFAMFDQLPCLDLISSSPSSWWSQTSHFNGSCDLSELPALDLQYEYSPPVVSGEEKSLCGMCYDVYQFDPLYATLDIVETNPNMFGDQHQGYNRRPDTEDGKGLSGNLNGSPFLWSDSFVTNYVCATGAALVHQSPQPARLPDSNVSNSVVKHENSEKSPGQGTKGSQSRKRPRDMKEYKYNVNNSASEALTWEMLSQYFYLPIAQAAKELNIGLTQFKKRCRELGVRRWPHRKLNSINALIKNIQEMEKDGSVNPNVSKGTIHSAIRTLEEQRRRMELKPDIQLEAQTKKLRQACFKANYKKRRLMTMNDGSAISSSSSNSKVHGSASASSTATSSNNNGCSASKTESITTTPGLEENEELKSLLFDSLSPSDCMFLGDLI